MKVIDLLNKIANGEDAPKKIKLRNFELIRTYDDEARHLYVDKDNMFFPLNYTYKLDDEIEILEEEKKIPEKLDHLIGYDIQQFDDLKEYVEITTNDLFGKVNKIIDTLNQLIDYLKSKGE